ncbi:hypothetical protein L1887_42048 [Cichorium endivia]|nr:hypothetical protein L1887_42048 [Cichorium endivia]
MVEWESSGSFGAARTGRSAKGDHTLSHWAEGTLNSAGRGIRTRRAQCGDDGLARGHACMALAHTGMLAVTLWLKIAAERAAQLYMGCRCPGSVACGADWHVHAGMAQDRWRDAKSESRTVAGPGAAKRARGGERPFEPRVLARVALLDVSLVREAWRHSWTSIPNLGRALPQKPREKGGFQLHSVSTDGGGQSRKVLFRAHLARPPQLHRPFFTLPALPMLVMCFSSVFPFGTVGTVSPLDPPSSRQH